MLAFFPTWSYSFYLLGEIPKEDVFEMLTMILPLLLLLLGIFLYMRRKTYCWSLKFKITEDGIETWQRGKSPVFLRWNEMDYPKSDILREEIQIRAKTGDPIIILDRSLDEISLVSDLVYSMIRPGECEDD